MYSCSPLGMSNYAEAYFWETTCEVTKTNVLVSTSVYNYFLGRVEFSKVDKSTIEWTTKSR